MAIIDILGQRAHIPVNQSLVFVIIILVIGLVTIEFISKGVSDTIKYVATGSYSKVVIDGSSKGFVQSARIYQFWTPGETTWKDMVNSCSSDKKCLSEIQKWKKTNFTTNIKLSNFGKALQETLDVPGYSRFPVIGSGGGTEKSGWYWRIIFSGGNKLDKDVLATVYEKFFKRKNVRIEESFIGKQN